MENHNHELHVQIQELKGKLETLHQSLSKATYMDNWLREFEELLLHNALLKCRIKPQQTKIQNGKNGGRPYKKLQRSKSKTIWKLLMQMKSLFYLNKLVTYRLQFEGYTCDQLNSKLVEVHVNVLKKFSPMQPSFVTMSS